MVSNWTYILKCERCHHEQTTNKSNISMTSVPVCRNCRIGKMFLVKIIKKKKYKKRNIKKNHENSYTDYMSQ